ncbi:hypothetical protein DW014_14335 [Coprobacillus sp. AF37-2]|nr:hypothetical protein DW014_14335 [Coprobacillus sp. AF37-2]RHT88567.1 hypothetical protein DW736_12735 [Coprobacillus sp. AM28-15LB]
MIPKNKNWCQNRKNHNFKGNKILQNIDFKWLEKNNAKISTHLLTVLKARTIMYLEIRKGINKEPSFKS